MTRTPTSIATTTVRGCSTSPLFGSVKPTASKSLNRPVPSASPTRIPAIEARIPIASASTKIEPSTCLREAPSVRRVASSRVRCVIVIDSELAITNAPTKSAIPPKASRNPWRKLRKLSVSFASSLACAVPVRTCVPGGRIDSIWPARRSGDTPGLAFARIWSSLPRFWNSTCAVGRSKPARVAPPRLAAPPNLTRPETRMRIDGPLACTAITSPTFRSFLCAVDPSTTTSSVFGQLPSDRVSELRSGLFGSTLNPRFGAPPKTITLPFLPIRCASPPTPPTAWSTSGSFRTSPRSDSSKGGATVLPLFERSNADWPVIVASVPL